MVSRSTVNERPTERASRLRPSRPIPRWIAAVVILAGLLSAAGAFIAWLRPSLLAGVDGPVGQATRVYAGYLISRDLGLSVTLFTLLAFHAYRMLAGALTLFAVIQSMDSVIDAATGRLTLVPGLIILTALFLAAAATLCRPQSLWRPATWRPETTSRPTPAN